MRKSKLPSAQASDKGGPPFKVRNASTRRLSGRYGKRGTKRIVQVRSEHMCRAAPRDVLEALWRKSQSEVGA